MFGREGIRRNRQNGAVVCLPRSYLEDWPSSFYSVECTLLPRKSLVAAISRKRRLHAIRRLCVHFVPKPFEYRGRFLRLKCTTRAPGHFPEVCM